MKSRSTIFFLGLIFIISSSFLITQTPQSHPNKTTDTHTDGCLVCHDQENFYAQLKNGELVSMNITEEHTTNSVHWNEEIYCADCHQDQAKEQHPNPDLGSCETCHGKNMDKTEVILNDLTFQLTSENKREMSISLNQICINCHEEEAEKTSDSTHQIVFDQGNRSAPICIDCHSSHYVEKPNQPRSRISSICSECHLSVFSTYRESVHGSALIGEGNLDVPSCVDCHGVHSISGPYDITFRNASIIMCTTCHADEKLMTSYGISTLVADTYLNDFHGRSANLFIVSKDNRPTDKAVCFDCHGIHSILPPNNPASQVYPENLLGTCQKCHIDANISFPDEWLDHYVPTFEDNPSLYIINLIYPILIGIIISSSILYIYIDARKRHIERKETEKMGTINNKRGGKK